MSIATDWWKDFFHGVVVDLWLAFPTPEMTSAETDFLVEHLHLQPGARVLDTPCGGGRHAVELAERGFQVTAVDLSTAFLAHARKAAAERGVQVDLHEREMRNLPWRETFDGAFCWGNSFAYLDDTGNLDFLSCLSKALKPGSRFVLELGSVAESILPNYQERRWYQVGDIYFLVQNRHNLQESCLESELVFVRDGKTERRAHRQRIYTYRELSKLLQDAGFVDIKGYAGLRGEPFRLGCQPLIMTAVKA
jgi:SAM-dependent methyltransferase